MNAQTIGDVAKSFTYSFSLFPAVLMAFCVVGGLVLCIRGILKLKAHSDTRGQVKLSEALLYVVCGTALLCIPAVLTIGKELMGVGDTKGKDVLKYVEKQEKY
ncbi:MAG: hypothetical protein RSD65_08860 [Anaerovoracaceae bacterium]